MKRIRLLWSANAMWAGSGYGIQGRYLLPRLQRLDTVEELRTFAWFGLQGGKMEVSGIMTYPVGYEAYGNDIVGDWARDMQANVVITLIDAWVLKDIAQKVSPALFLPYFPIDHDPIPENVLRGINGAWRPVVYSKFAAKLMSERGWPYAYIPHGVEPSVMRVLPPDARAKWRSEANIPQDAFLAVMVAANQDTLDRKAFGPQLTAFARFLEDVPDAWLYVHGEPSAIRGGLDIPGLARALGIEARVRYPTTAQFRMGFSHDFVAQVYNAADVLLAASRSEGFGIPIVEAQACGIPVITSDFASMTELVRWGTAVKPLDYAYTPAEAFVVVPDAHGIYAALVQAETERRQPDYEQVRRHVSRQVQSEYGWDRVVSDGWQPLFEQVVTWLNRKAPPLREWDRFGPQVAQIGRSARGVVLRANPTPTVSVAAEGAPQVEYVGNGNG